jgi:molecular chaperone HscB
MAIETPNTAAQTHVEPEALAAPTCWFCRELLAARDHFCPHCGKVQPLQPVDYFSFLGLPRKLNVDVDALQREFYRLSRKLHPDVHAQSTADEQQWAEEKSSQLNDAYRTLKDPIARTRYLLGLEGVQLEEQSRNATDAARASGAEKKQVVPPDMLEEVFELNMQLEELRAEKKMGEADPGVVSELESARRRFEERMDGLMNELRALWNEWDAVEGQNDSNTRIRVRDRMVDTLNRRSYVRNLLRDVNEALEN